MLSYILINFIAATERMFALAPIRYKTAILLYPAYADAKI